MTATLQESIMIAAMEGDLPRLLLLGREGLDRSLLLGDETLNVLGWSGPAVMPAEAVWEDFIHEGFAPLFHWSDDLLKANSRDLPYGFSVCHMHTGEARSHWVVDIEMPGGRPLHLILSEQRDPPSPPLDFSLLGLVCLSVRTCVNNRMGNELIQPFSSEQLLLQLIRSGKIDEPLLRFRAQSIHMESEGYFALLMLDLRDYHPQRSSIATIRNQLASVVGNHSIIDGETLTFLISYNTEAPEEQRQLWEKVEPILSANALFGVFSCPFYRLGEFHYHYTQTLNTLKLRFCARPGQFLVSCDDLAIYSLIAHLRESDPLSVHHSAPIRILQQSDRNRKTSYIETLFSYLAHAQKPAPTCADLHIHRNTLDYRLRKIEELTGLDWADGELMFRLYFSLCVIRYDQLAGNQTPLV